MDFSQLRLCNVTISRSGKRFFLLFVFVQPLGKMTWRVFFGARQGFQFHYPLCYHHELLFLFCKNSPNRVWCMLFQILSKLTEWTVCSARIFLNVGQLLYLLKLSLIFMHYLRGILLFCSLLWSLEDGYCLWPRRAVFIITSNLYGFKHICLQPCFAILRFKMKL